ncbi:hypothetical protein ACFL6U_12590 [Planctomycetota bacterium]
MVPEESSIGRATSVLVLGSGEGQRALITSIIAQISEDPSNPRIRFTGKVEFTASVQKHIRCTILPIVDRILAGLALPKTNFTLSAVNPGVSSVLDIGMRVSGFSADIPMLLSLLSIALELPIPNNMIFTGHVASVHGDISAVRAISTKLQAAIKDTNIRFFLYPDLSKDQSLEVLSPQEREQSMLALMQARDSIKTIGVSTVSELVHNVFSDNSVVQASLRKGFFPIRQQVSEGDDGVQGAISALANNQERFWKVLQENFHAGDDASIKQVLQSFAYSHIDRKSYPPNIGQELFNLICTIAPAVRRSKIVFPILEIHLCKAMIRYAKDADDNDIPILFDAIRGKTTVYEMGPGSAPCRPDDETLDSDCNAFDALVSLINEQALAHRFGVPIDSARASYILKSSTVTSYNEFIDTLTAFYIHLHRYINPDSVGSPEMSIAGTESLDLLNHAFSSQGGEKTALDMGINGTQGGMRRVLDMCTEQFKREQQGKYIHRIIKDTVELGDWDKRVALMRGALKRLRSFLPSELKDEPPERFIREKETELIVQAYIKWLDSLNHLLYSM